jgi:hypothetical protein
VTDLLESVTGDIEDPLDREERPETEAGDRQPPGA